MKDPNLQDVAAANVSRRQMLKATATAMVAAPLVAAQPAKQAQSKSVRFFTPAEFALVDELTEIIIPTDEHSPGARAAKVAAYIDTRLAEAFTAEPRQQWRAGLQLIDKLAQEMHAKKFMQASAEQRLAVITRIAEGEQNPAKPEEKFFVELKQRTAHAYYTSRIGIHQEIEYKGNVYLKEYVGEEVK